MMKLIEADKVEQAIKDYWKAQVDKALTLTDGNEKRINIYLEHNHELLKAIDELPSAEPDTTTHDSNVVKKGGNDEYRTTDDYISRQQAINAIRDYLVGKRCPDDGTLTCRLIENEVINKLPSAQPEIIRCKDCLMHGVCRFEQGLGLDGYCSQTKRRTDDKTNKGSSC